MSKYIPSFTNSRMKDRLPYKLKTRVYDEVIEYRNVSIGVIHAGPEAGYWIEGLNHSTHFAACTAIDCLLKKTA